MTKKGIYTMVFDDRDKWAQKLLIDTLVDVQRWLELSPSLANSANSAIEWNQIMNATTGLLMAVDAENVRLKDKGKLEIDVLVSKLNSQVDEID